MRAVLLFCLLGFAAAAFAEDPAADHSVVLLHVDGKEVKLAAFKLTTGTRRLSWLADPKATAEDAHKGPQALEIREANSTSFAKGVVTLVPVSHLESAKYDYEKLTVSIGLKGYKEPLTGTLQYKGLNVMGLSAAVDGKTTTFSAGVVGKTAVKTVTFSGAKPLPEPSPALTTWSVVTAQPTGAKEKESSPLVVRNLKLLYQFPAGVEKLEDSFPIRNGTAMALPAVKRLELLATDTNTNMTAAELETAQGMKQIVIIPLTLEQDKKTGTLVGFLGEVDVGWKLFPLHTVKVLTLTDAKKKVE